MNKLAAHPVGVERVKTGFLTGSINPHCRNLNVCACACSCARVYVHLVCAHACESENMYVCVCARSFARIRSHVVSTVLVCVCMYAYACALCVHSLDACVCF